MTLRFLTCAPGGMRDDCGFHSGYFEPGAFEILNADKYIVSSE